MPWKLQIFQVALQSQTKHSCQSFGTMAIERTRVSIYFIDHLENERSIQEKWHSTFSYSSYLKMKILYIDLLVNYF